jgi:NitT/TauT family transport system ATP-binding protein
MYIQVKDVTKTFPVGGKKRDGKRLVALDDISLEIEEGSFVAVCGPSGCGKSTLLRLIHGLDKPDSGEIYAGGALVDRPSLSRGMVFQGHNLMPWRTIERNVALGLESLKVPKAERAERVKNWLDKVGLRDFAEYYPAQLSGGMQQRVGLARALVLDPEALLMDEPFGALDAQTRVVLQEELERIWETEAKTAVFITHDIDEALFLADRVVVMSARPGRIVADIAVDAPRPRGTEWRSSAKFGELKGQIWDLLRSSAEESTRLSSGA